MVILAIATLCILTLAMILSTVIVDERKSRQQDMPEVKLRGYWDGSERRSADRLNISLGVKYYANGKGINTRSADISTKGIKLLLDEKIGKDTPLRLEIKLPDEKPIIRAHGVSVWSNESQEDEKGSPKRLFTTGIKFAKFHADGEQRLFDFIYKSRS